MKRIYSLFAIMLSATTLMAQSVPFVTTGDFTLKAPCKKNITMTHAATAKTAARSGARALASNQKYAGAYTSDTYNTESGAGYPLVNMDLGVFAYMSKSLLAKYNGSKIVGMRYALSNVAEVTRATIYSLDTPGNTEIIASQSIYNSVRGWNTVMFSQPTTLDLTDLQGLFVGFSYFQNNDTNADESFPLSFVTEGNSTAPVYLFGDLGYGNGLYPWPGEQNGNLSVQLILENNNFPKKDAVINDIAIAGDWYKAGEDMTYAVAVNNFGTQTINELELGVYIDNALVTTQKVNNVTETIQNVSGTVTLPAGLSLGQHTLTVYAANADGTPLTENTDDDAMALRIFTYEQSVTRQKNLIEQFTSQYCAECPEGISNVDNFIASRSNDIACVTIHADMGDDMMDEFTVLDGEYVLVAEAVSGIPSASFNRTAVRRSLIQPTTFESNYTPSDITRYFNDIIDYTHKNPALATVNISGSYNEATRALEVTVSGEGVNAAELLANYGVTVCLTEDNIKAKQINADGRTWNYSYVHNNVLRATLTENKLGDKIKWTGNTYEMTFNTVLDAGWNADHMHVVAFVAPVLDYNNPDYLCEWVTNANSVTLKNIADGISEVNANATEGVEVARYNAAGQLISAPQKGINIIKMSNGETHKVLVK